MNKDVALFVVGMLGTVLLFMCIAWYLVKKEQKDGKDKKA